MADLSATLREAAHSLKSHDAACRLCPRECAIDRRSSRGYCRSGVKAGIASHNLHFGEEPFLSGTRGSGTVFFHHCTLRCVFCQNFPISQLHDFPEVTDEKLAEVFLELQEKKAHNLNLVTGTHFLPAIASALVQAKEKGFRLPVVWNSSGYEKEEIVRLMEPLVDVYLPDLKYADEETARELSDAPGYPAFAKSAIREMFRQKGHLRTLDGQAVSGLVVRHLVLPGRIEESKRILDFLAGEISTDLSISLMSQYFPAWKAAEKEGMDRVLSAEEYVEITDYALSLGLDNALIQDMDKDGNC